MRSPNEKRFNVEKGLLLASVLACACVAVGMLDGREWVTWTGPTCDERPAPHRPVELTEPSDLGRYVHGADPFGLTDAEKVEVKRERARLVREVAKRQADERRRRRQEDLRRINREREKRDAEKTKKTVTTTTRLVGWIEVEDKGRKTIVEVSGRDGYLSVEPGEVLPESKLEVVEVVGDELTVVDEDGNELKGKIISVTRTVPAE